MRTVITGSKEIDNIQIVRKAVEASRFSINEVVSGMGRGVDRLGEQWARKQGLRVKRVYPDRTVVLGGVGPAAIEDEILRRVPEVDMIFRGEGDVAGPALIGALRDHEPVDEMAGVSFRRNGSVIHNPAAPRMQ